MKLKQRLLIFGSMFVVMMVIFIVGMSFGSDSEQPAQSQANELATEAPKPPTVRPPALDDIKQVVRPNLEHLPGFEALARRPGGPLERHGIPHIPAPQPAGGMRQMHEDLAQLPHPVPLNDNLGNQQREGQIDRDSDSDQVALEVFQDSVPPEIANQDPWQIWKKWVKPDFLCPEDGFWSDEMRHILNSMATAPITSFGLGHRGTQLKASMMLSQQRTAFKPMRYPRDEVIEGDPYAGFDRHNAEIAGFHLDGILDFRIAPPVVGRKLNLTELLPVTSDKLLTTYFKEDGNMCFYGKCYYCKKSEAACATGEIMEGSVILWLPDWYELKSWRSPYQRTYRRGYNARWEVDDNFCQKLLHPKSEYYYGILELTDSSIFDFLMGNADRHHYETYSKAPHHGRIMHFDSGKSFGNPYKDELSILAPLKQCCRVKESTWNRLQELQGRDGPLSRVLDASLKRDPLYPILTAPHLAAIDRRLSTIISTVEQCIEDNEESTVIVQYWG